jgi:hypothetical protein
VWDQSDNNRLARGLSRIAREIQDDEPEAAAGLRAEAASCRRGHVQNDPRATAWRERNRSR